MASRYCFREFDTVENAQKAMDNLNGRMLLHKRLVVQPAVERDSSGQHGLPSTSSSMSPAREEKLLDKKIEELKKRINATKKCRIMTGAAMGDTRELQGFVERITPVPMEHPNKPYLPIYASSLKNSPSAFFALQGVFNVFTTTACSNRFVSSTKNSCSDDTNNVFL
jgi:RNA recognition motif-containing protein